MEEREGERQRMTYRAVGASALSLGTGAATARGAAARVGATAGLVRHLVVFLTVFLVVFVLVQVQVVVVVVVFPVISPVVSPVVVVVVVTQSRLRRGLFVRIRYVSTVQGYIYIIYTHIISIIISFVNDDDE